MGNWVICRNILVLLLGNQLEHSWGFIVGSQYRHIWGTVEAYTWDILCTKYMFLSHFAFGLLLVIACLRELSIKLIEHQFKTCSAQILCPPSQIVYTVDYLFDSTEKRKYVNINFEFPLHALFRIVLALPIGLAQLRLSVSVKRNF